MTTNLSSIFSGVYGGGRWSAGGARSGIGSTIAYAESFCVNLKKIVLEYDIKQIVDLSCGDWTWMKTIYKDLPDYTGVDVVQELIDEHSKNYGSDKVRFVASDMVEYLSTKTDKIDLVVCRQTFEHLSKDYILKALHEIKRVSNYAILTSVSDNVENVDGEDGGEHQRNLEITPFIEILGPPIRKFWDSVGTDPGNGSGYYGNLYKFI